MSWRVRAIRKTKQNIGGWWSSLFGIVDYCDRIWSGPDMTTLEPTELVENSSKMIPCCCQRQQDCMVWTSVILYRVLNSTTFWNKFLSPPQANFLVFALLLIEILLIWSSFTSWWTSGLYTLAALEQNYRFLNRAGINYLVLMEMLSLPNRAGGWPRTQYLIPPP